MSKTGKAAIVGGTFLVLSAFVPVIFKSDSRTPGVASDNSYSSTEISSSTVVALSEEKEQRDTFRKLEPLETGKEIGDLPNGVYFFAYAFSVSREVATPEEDTIKTTSKRCRDCFEIQKQDSRYYVIGFVSDEIFSRLGELSTGKSAYGILSPYSWGGAAHPIGIPFDSIYTIAPRTINLDEKTDMDILDIGFKEAVQNPIVHLN